MPFLTDEDTGDLLTTEQFGTYCDKMEKATVWGGQPEVIYDWILWITVHHFQFRRVLKNYLGGGTQ